MGNNNTIGGGGFHHVAMKVKDFDASVAFYASGLGFTKSAEWGAVGERAIMLDTGDGNYVELFEGGPDKRQPENDIVMHFALRTDDCDKAVEAARAAGAQITMEPENIDIQSNPVKPVRIAFCRGLDNEVIEFFQER